MGGRVQVYLGIMEDEVLDMDELAGKGEKTVAQRAFVEALVEEGGGVLGGGDRRQERQIEPGGDPIGHGLRIEVLRQNDPLVPVQGESVSRSAPPNANQRLNSKG